MCDPLDHLTFQGESTSALFFWYPNLDSAFSQGWPKLIDGDDNKLSLIFEMQSLILVFNGLGHV